MDILQKITAVSLVVIFMGLFTYALCQMGLFLHHWHKVVTNISNKYAPLIGALLLLDSTNFNEVGKEHLLKSKSTFKRFVLSIIPVLLFIGVASYIRHGAGK